MTTPIATPQAVGMPGVPVPIEPEKIDEALKALLKERVDEEASIEKQKSLIRLEKCDRYNKLQQHLYPKFEGSTGAVRWASIEQSGSDIDRSGVRDYVIDVTKTYGAKYTAVMGSRPFYNATVVAERPQKEEDRKSARSGGLLQRWLADRWQVTTESFNYFWMQWASGTVYGYLTWEADAEVFGTHEEPTVTEKQVELSAGGYRCLYCGAEFDAPNSRPMLDDMGGEFAETTCPKCGESVSDYQYEEPEYATVPEIGPSVSYALPGPKITLLSSAFVTVPPDCNDIRKAQYVLYEYEEHRGVLLAKYGDKLRKHLGADGTLSGGKSAARQKASLTRTQMSSLDSASQTGTSKNRWTHARYWIKPEMFEYAGDDKIRAALKEAYPTGLKITLVDGLIVAKEDESPADCWVVGKLEPSNTLYNDPMCWRVLPLQDAINDFWNLMISVVEKVVPSFIYNPEIISKSALNGTAFQPGDGIPAIGGTALGSATEKLPSASFPDHAQEMVGGLTGHLESSVGLLPAIYGGGEKSSTAEESRNRLNQAIQQLSVSGGMATQFWCDAYDRGIRMIAKRSPVPMEVASGMGRNASTSVIDPAELSAGRFRVVGHPGLPMSFTERRDQLNQIITQNPELAQQLGLALPENSSVLKDYILTGMDDLQLPDDNRWKKTMDTIQLLLEQEPVPGPDGRMMPSMEPEPYIVTPGDEAQRVLAWLLSDPGRELGKKNTPGYQNVVAYGMLCSDLAAPPPMPLQPGVEGAPPPPGDQPPTP